LWFIAEHDCPYGQSNQRARNGNSIATLETTAVSCSRETKGPWVKPTIETTSPFDDLHLWPHY
jgi:hypothetical protein